MTARTFAALSGAFYIVLAILGFVPAVWERPQGSGALRINVFYADILGIFTTNIILSMIHLVMGFWGVMSANNRYSAIVFCRSGAFVFVVLGIAGAVPIQVVRTVYGTVPLSGENVVLHLVTAVIAVFFAIRPGYELTTIGVQKEINPHAPGG